MDTIPVELLPNILEMALPPYDCFDNRQELLTTQAPEQHLALHDLCLVSRLWKEVAEATPELWTLMSLSTAFPPSTIPVERLARLSRSAPLKIDIQMHLRGDSRFWSIVNQLLTYKSRWQTLRIRKLGNHWSDFKQIIPAEMVALEEAHLEGQFYIASNDGREILYGEAFASTPQLRRLGCCRGVPPIPFLHFAALKQLTLHDLDDVEWYIVWHERLVHVIETCPNLEVLEVIGAEVPFINRVNDEPLRDVLRCKFLGLKLLKFNDCSVATISLLLGLLSVSTVVDIHLEECVGDLLGFEEGAQLQVPPFIFPGNASVRWEFVYFETFCAILENAANPEEVTWRVDTRLTYPKPPVTYAQLGIDLGRVDGREADLRKHWTTICDLAPRTEWILPDGSVFRVGGRDALEILLAALRKASR